MDNSFPEKSYPIGGTAKRTVLGGLMNTIGYGITVFQQIIFVPVFLWAWGEAAYGEWLTLFSLVAYVSISHLGMGTYVRNTLIQAYARGDHKAYASALKSAFGIFGIISALFFVALVLFAVFVPFPKWFNIELAGESSVRLAVLILGSYILLGVLGGLVNGLYSTLGEYPRQMALRNFRDVLLILFVVLVLVLGGEFVSVALVYLLILMGFTLFVISDIWKRYPEIKNNLRDVGTDWKLAKSFVKPGLIFLLIPFSGLVYIQGSVLLIGAVLGASAVAIFGVHRTLANAAKRLVNIVIPAILPELTTGEARGEYDKLRRIHGLSTKLLLLVSMTATIFLFFGGGDMLRIWTGGKIVLDPDLWILLLVLIPISVIWESNAVFQVATNKYNKYAVSRVVSVFLGFLLAFIFIKSLGLAGVVLGFLIGQLVTNFWFVPLHTLKIIKARKRDFVLLILKGVPLFVLQFVIGWGLAVVIHNAWFMIGAVGVMVTSVGIAYTYFLWLDKKEKQLVGALATKSARYIRAKFTPLT